MPSFSPGLIATIGSIAAGIILLFMGFKAMMQVKRVNSISKSVPSFVSSLMGQMRTGLVLSEAVILIAKDTYFKHLSPLLKVAAERIKKGMPVSTALDIMARQLDNSLFFHVASVISKVEESGGNVTGILEKMEQYVNGSVKASSKRATDMSSYAMVTFISFGVLLFTLLLAVGMIFPRLSAASSIKVASFGVSLGGIQIITWAFFAVSITYAIGNGLISGVFTSGSVKAGSFYAGFLLILTAISFFVVSGGVA